MSPIQAFFLGLAVTTTLAFTVVWYITSPLKAILVDLCGSERRADFWMAFTHVTLVLVPTICAMEFYPEAGEGSPALFQTIEQLKWALMGLIASVAGVGAVLSSFIRTAVPHGMAKPERKG